jgi:hypothetical protein
MTSRERCASMMLVSEPVVGVDALVALSDLLCALAGAPPRIGADAISSSAEAPRHGRRRTAQLDLDCLAQLRWSDLAPELRERLGELLTDLLRQAAASGDVAGEARDDQ